MRKYSFTNNGKTWERITKKQAHGGNVGNIETI